MCICVHINIKTHKQENNKTLKVVRVTLRQSVLPLSVPLWAAWHTNVELIQRRTMFCFTSIDVGVLHALVAGHDGNGTDLYRHTDEWQQGRWRASRTEHPQEGDLTDGVMLRFVPERCCTMSMDATSYHRSPFSDGILLSETPCTSPPQIHIPARSCHFPAGVHAMSHWCHHSCSTSNASVSMLLPAVYALLWHWRVT